MLQIIMHYCAVATYPEDILYSHCSNDSWQMLMNCISGYKMEMCSLTLTLLMSYIYGAPSKARNANVVYIWTYVWQR